MDDTQFFELQLASLFPSASKWPSEFTHQRTLLGAVNEATELMRRAQGKLNHIAANKDLTPEAKKRQWAELAAEVIAELEGSATLIRAREAAEHALQRYEEQISSKLTPATDAATVGVHTQIRDQLRAITDPKDRMNFLARNGNDLALISAVLSAPAYVSGISDAELALLRRNLEQHTDSAIIHERDFVRTALAEVERGYRAARSRISKQAGLRDGGMGATPKSSNKEPTKASAWTTHNAA
jgi:hypothetical protein